jgi:putative copper resistance protein D
MSSLKEIWGQPLRIAAFIGLSFVVILLCTPFVRAQQQQQQNSQDMQDMQDMPEMDMHQPMVAETPAMLAKRVADKKESEFNHHLAGFLLVIAGIFLLAQERLAGRWPWARYVWPACFLIAGIYLLLFSDTEMWPIGPQTPWFAIRNNPEDLQHKVFSLILLGLGGIELQRARGRLKSAWAAWAFPVLGMVGAVMLLFHHHSAGMNGAHHMDVMMHIQEEHRGFAATGGGIALTKGLSEAHTDWQEFFKKTWPTLMIVLGVLLMVYTE